MVSLQAPTSAKIQSVKREVPSYSERKEALLDLAGGITLAIFVVPPMSAFWIVLAYSAFARYKPSPWEFVAIFAAWAVVWVPVAGAASAALWLATMRLFLPARVLRRWALYGPRVPLLTNLTEKLCDRLLGPADRSR